MPLKRGFILAGQLRRAERALALDEADIKRRLKGRMKTNTGS